MATENTKSTHVAWDPMALSRDVNEYIEGLFFLLLVGWCVCVFVVCVLFSSFLFFVLFSGKF